MGSAGKRIVLFGPWPPPYGGVASHVQDLARNMAIRGVPVRILGYGDFWMRPGLWRVSVSRDEWWKTKLWLRLALSRGTLVHDHSGLLANPEEDLLDSFAAMVRVRRARWILTLHDETVIQRFRSWPAARQRVFEKFAEIPDYIICVSMGLRRFLEDLGIREARLESIPSLLPIHPIQEVRLSKDLAVFLQRHRPLLTTVGAFHGNYDFLGIAEALPAVIAEYPQAGLVMIDAGFTVDETHRRSVLAALERLEPSMYFLASRLPRDEVLQVLRASSVFIRGARYDAFGISKVEAILAGTPVVTTGSGETRHMKIYEFGNSAQLGAVLCEIIRHSSDVRHSSDLSEAQHFYRTMAEQTLDRILDVYDRTSG